MEENCVSDTTPDWSTLDIELTCPRCGYDVKMLTQPRCPECGLRFKWDELIRAKQEFHTRPPIFEYHWRDHPIRSFCLTVSMCLQPWRLWRWVPLTAVPSIRTMPFLIVLVVALLVLLSLSGRSVWFAYRQMTTTTPIHFQSFPWLGFWIRFSHELVPPSVLILVVWLSIQVFQQTISRYRIRQRHLVRLAVFTWVGVVGSRFVGEFILDLMMASYRWIYQSRLPTYFYQLIRFVDALPLIILVLSLGFSLQSYLRVRGGWLWALLLSAFASVLIVVVGLVISVLILDTFDNRYWRWLGNWSEFFEYLRDLASWAFLSWHGY